MENLFVKLHTCSVCRLGHLFLAKFSHWQNSQPAFPSCRFTFLNRAKHSLLYKIRTFVTNRTSHPPAIHACSCQICSVSVDKLLLQGPHYLRPGWHSSSVYGPVFGLQRLPVPLQYLSHLPIPVLFNHNEPCYPLSTPALAGKIKCGAQIPVFI